MNETESPYAAAISAAIAHARFSRDFVVVTAPDGAEVHAYPHLAGIEWVVYSGRTGEDILHGIRTPQGEDVEADKDVAADNADAVACRNDMMRALGGLRAGDALFVMSSVLARMSGDEERDDYSRRVLGIAARRIGRMADAVLERRRKLEAESEAESNTKEARRRRKIEQEKERREEWQLQSAKRGAKQRYAAAIEDAIFNARILTTQGDRESRRRRRGLRLSAQGRHGVGDQS